MAPEVAKGVQAAPCNRGAGTPACRVDTSVDARPGRVFNGASGMNPNGQSVFTAEAWLEEAAASGAAAVSEDRIAPERRAELLERLVKEIGREVYADSARAEKLVEACDALAALLPGKTAEGKAVRARGHLQFARSQHAEAAELYERAVGLFRQEGDRVTFSVPSVSRYSLISVEAAQGAVRTP